jgi:hypothetical protein
LPEQGENAIELKQESTVQQAITTEDGLTQKTNDSKTATSNKSANSISNNKKVLKKTKQAAFLNYTQKTAPSKNNDLKIGNEQASAPTSINETKPLTGVYSDSLAKSTEFNDIDTISNTKPIEKTAENDSVAIQKYIATTRKSISTKWKFAIEAGIGISGVSNGVSLFGGGTKSLSTNAFARDMFLSFSGTPSNTSQGSTYRPPSTQQKSGSSLIGVLVKKQVTKRSFLSTGLQYNFYSTQMQVGQSVNRDTVVDSNKSVANFYTNSGSNFSNYQNKFHFISLPVAFDFQLLNKLPLDLHIGFSIQQLVQTNALIYSSLSQVYYNDEEAFNKTYLFSHLGLEYSFPLNKKLSLKAGPRVNYSHSRVMKESDRHLFSYGLVTQLVFSGK